MTTLLDRISTVLGPTSADALEVKLQQAREALTVLTANVASAALPAEEGIEGARDALDAANETLRQGEERVRNLTFALESARTREATKTQAQRDAIKKSQHERMRVHCRERDAAGAKLAEHLASAVNEWRAMVAANDAMVQALPADEKLPQGSGAALSDLHTAVLSELWRAGGSPHVGLGWGVEKPPPSWPGAQPIDPASRYDPSKEIGLLASLRQSTEYLLRTIINVKG